MRVAALVVVSALALAACSKPAENGAAAPGSPQTGAANPGGVVGNMFPNLFQASYRMEATINSREGQSMPVVMVRSGQNMRMEMDTHGQHIVTIQNAATHQGYTLMNMAGRQVAMQVDMTGAASQDPLAVWARAEGYTTTRGGPCAGAGQTGTEWTTTKAATENAPAESHTVCATSDGIVLQVRDGERVVLQATSVQRGPQDPAQFNLPPGVQVMNMGNAAAMIAAARGHAKP